jgi:hypothetical protein
MWNVDDRQPAPKGATVALFLGEASHPTPTCSHSSLTISPVSAVAARRAFFDLISEAPARIMVSQIPEHYIANGAPSGTPDHDLAGGPDDDSACGFGETTG